MAAENPPVTAKGSPRAGLIAVICAICICPGLTETETQGASSTRVASGESSASLKGQSNEALVRLMICGKSARMLERQEDRKNNIETRLPEKFVDLPPREAALALVQENCNLKLRGEINIAIASDRPAPRKGCVKIRWSAGVYNVPHEGTIDMLVDESDPRVLFSNVEVLGTVKEHKIENAVKKTERSKIPAEEVRRLYEIIWWLGRIQFTPVNPSNDQSTFTSEWVVITHETTGEFTVQPDGPRAEHVRLHASPVSMFYQEEFDLSLYASLANFVLRSRLTHHGLDLDRATAVVGKSVTSPEEELRSKRPMPGDPSTAKWIGQMLLLMRKDFVTWDLVPDEEPMRYQDSRIDEALFRMLRNGRVARKDRPRAYLCATHAAEALVRRGRGEAFPLIMQLLEVKDDRVGSEKNDLLEVATVLANKKPDYRRAVIEYLTEQLADLANSPHYSSALFDSVWRGDFREMKPLLEKISTNSVDEMEDDRGVSLISPPRPVTGHFHGARRILTAWNESDALTRLKLNAIIEVSTSHLGKAAEFLRHEFAILPTSEQQEFRSFVQWLDQYQPIECEVSWNVLRLTEVLGDPH